MMGVSWPEVEMECQENWMWRLWMEEEEEGEEKFKGSVVRDERRKYMKGDLS
jgi:hypothetical protein